MNPALHSIDSNARGMIPRARHSDDRAAASKKKTAADSAAETARKEAVAAAAAMVTAKNKKARLAKPSRATHKLQKF